MKKNKVANIQEYHEKMHASIYDKLWFIDKQDANVFIDFGCADGYLLQWVKRFIPNAICIGYDPVIKISDMVHSDLGNTDHVFLFNDLDDVYEFLDTKTSKSSDKTCMIFSSVLHEIEDTEKELLKIVNTIKRISPNYIAIRDMQFVIWEDLRKMNKLKELIKKKYPKKSRDFFKEDKYISDRKVLEFLAKCGYDDNWKKELNEDYNALRRAKHVFSYVKNEYSTTYFNQYCLQYFQNKWFKEYPEHFNPIACIHTHFNLLIQKII